MTQRIAVLLPLLAGIALADPLPSWNDTAAKKRIRAFVAEVTNPESPRYVPPEARIAVFDNDGTLWAEKPLYIQAAFVFARVKALAERHPEWKDRQPFQAVLENDREKLAHLDVPDLLQLIAATHADMTRREFREIARRWLEQARHPNGARYTALVYQPMLELLRYLRDEGFQTWICTGGGIEFVRLVAKELYGIPPERVIGSSSRMVFELQEGRAVFRRKAELVPPINDKAGKPVLIQRHIGRKPILAFGNSDGDIEMMQYATAGEGPSLALLLHHDDAEREFSYTKGTEKALVEAEKRKWTVVSIRRDFGKVFPN